MDARGENIIPFFSSKMLFLIESEENKISTRIGQLIRLSIRLGSTSYCNNGIIAIKVEEIFILY